MKRLDRRNRLVGTLLALVLLAAGAYGLVRSYGVVGDSAADDPLLLDPVRRFVTDNDAWFWWAAFALALLVAYLAWRWLRVQLLPSPSLNELVVESHADGRTTMSAHSVAEAVTRELQDIDGVRSARVRLVGSDRNPALDVRVAVSDNADLDDVRRRIESDIVGETRTALERDDLTAKVRLRLGDPTARTLA